MFPFKTTNPPPFLSSDKVQCIYEYLSIRKKIWVYENSEFRWLCFDKKNIQTKIHKKHPQLLFMSYISPLCSCIKNSPTLLLGAGGGACIHHITKLFPEITLQAVEKNALVCSLAQKFFFVKSEYLINDDAYNYLKDKHTINYNHILVDIYDRKLPRLLKKVSFLRHLKQKSLHSVSFNLLGSKQEINHTMEKIHHIFEKNTIILESPEHSNIIMHAFLTKENLESYIVEQQLNNRITQLIQDIRYGFAGQYIPLMAGNAQF